ncbi:recombinase RecQ, partial [Xylella fastidiosa subsp. multiplex]|nr:recombinase RecQ [Xylella fastidiosa subsp. multiplex]
PVETEDERWLCLVSALRGLGAPRCALVYCATREETDDVSRWLTSAGFPAVAYHAGLPADLRRERSRAFRAGRLRLVCATCG